LNKIIFYVGIAENSYGVEAARLAGMPADVTKRAQVLLDETNNHHVDSNSSLIADTDNIENTCMDQQGMYANVHTTTSNPHHSHIVNNMVSMLDNDRRVIREVKNFDPNNSTPLDALKMIFCWQQALDKKKKFHGIPLGKGQ